MLDILKNTKHTKLCSKVIKMFEYRKQVGMESWMDKVKFTMEDLARTFYWLKTLAKEIIAKEKMTKEIMAKEEMTKEIMAKGIMTIENVVTENMAKENRAKIYAILEF